jgi:large subunit ribosomal protein L5
MSYIPRLKKEYKSNVVTRLIKEFSYDNVMQVPKLEKIVISKGVGAAVNDKKLIDHALNEVTEISGQKAIATMSKKDVASFKLRKGMPVGVKVTLRGEKMYEFLDRFVTTALPRVRDFSGVKSTGFDGRGNYNLGVTEQIIFPEINIDKINKISGMDITFVTSANSDKEAMQLLSELGLPFKKKESSDNNSTVEDKKPPVIEEAPSAEVEEESPVEEAPAAEVVEESAVEEVAEEAPVAEVVEESPVEEVAEEAPAAEVVEEAPVEEVAEEAPAAEDEEEPSKNEEEESKEDNK